MAVERAVAREARHNPRRRDVAHSAGRIGKPNELPL
jgi:hypothetical protein